MADVSGDVVVFTEHRDLLLGVAHRMLGSMADAEDVVQTARLRWSTVDGSSVKEPKSYLVTTVSRLSVDWLRRLIAHRKTYIGEWLPAPVSTERRQRTGRAGRETVELAMLVVLETLSPLERAVLVLREAFELPFTEIADVIRRRRAVCPPLTW